MGVAFCLGFEIDGVALGFNVGCDCELNLGFDAGFEIGFNVSF